jgi:hypothetical protein
MLKRTRTVFGSLGALLALGLIAACSTTVTRPAIQTQDFSGQPALALSVARVEVVEQYQSPLKEPNVEHTFPTTPAAAFKRWLGDRVKAEGQNDTLRVTIQDASAVRVPLPRTEGLEGMFTTDQVERIDATVSVLLEVVTNGGVAETFITAKAQRSRTLPEGLTLNERDKIYQEITEALVNDLNATIEQNVRQFLSKYLVS